MVTGASIPKNSSKTSQGDILDNSIEFESFLLFDEESTKDQGGKAFETSTEIDEEMFTTKPSSARRSKRHLVEEIEEVEESTNDGEEKTNDLLLLGYLFGAETSTEIEEEMFTTIKPSSAHRSKRNSFESSAEVEEATKIGEEKTIDLLNLGYLFGIETSTEMGDEFIPTIIPNL